MVEEDDWKNTLYIWDGIVTVGIPEVGEKQDSSVPLQWEGSWVPVESVPDAADAEAPKRHAFKKDIDADCNFLVKGTASELETETEKAKKEQKENNDDDDESKNEKKEEDRFFVAKLTKGDGWEMKDGDNSEKKSRHHDAVHDVWIRSLKWTGNQKDQRESLVVAKGENDFGPFVSVGWIRPGCRWTVARRYLSETDPRAGWSFSKLYQSIVETSIASSAKEPDFKVLLVPPWQTPVMHAKFQEPETPEDEPENAVGGRGKRRKIGAK